MSEKDIMVGLDIGTTKIGVIVAEKDQFSGIKVLGVGTSPSDGMRRGVVINIDKTVQSIKKAVEDAELMSGVEIRSVITGVAGDHIRSINSRGIVAVSRDHHEINQSDIERAIEAAQAVSLPLDQKIIHVLPQEFIVDDQDGVLDPVGMSGVRLEVEAHIVTGAVTSIENMYKSVERAGLHIQDIVLEPLASSYAVICEDERKMGVGLLDIGGGTTDIALFYEGSIRHTAVVALGGRNVTNDISIGLRTPPEQAEKIKIEYGCCYVGLLKEEEYIAVPGVGGREPRKVSRTILTRIIQPRMEEIYALALQKVKQSEYLNLLTSGIVITGGCSLLAGAVELAESVFDMPVRIGVPQGITGVIDLAKNPMFATCVGLIMYGYQSQGGEDRGNGESGKNTIHQRMKKWFAEFF